MRTKEFREAIYELAFGDNAINRGFSEEEVIATIKGFAHDSWVAEELDHEPSHSAREHWNANKAAEIEEQEDHNMETYRVGIHFEEGVVLTIKAESKEAAEKIAMDAAELFGGTEYPKKFNQDGVHREFCVTHTEENDND